MNLPPQGKLQEVFIADAFISHPYHNTLIGPMSDIQNFDRETALAFFKKYYVPSNMIIAIVGDVNPERFMYSPKNISAVSLRLPSPSLL